MRISDAEIRSDILDALEWDVRFDSPQIDVEVRNGHVVLSGNADSLSDKRLARRIASRIKGVREVSNELRVVPKNARSDEEIARDVAEALRRDVWVDESRIAVEVNRGAVRLSGTVDTFAHRDAALDDAWRTSGVVEVNDSLLVAPSVQRRDEEIASDVRDDLVRNIRVDPCEIDVTVSGGLVRLRGRVSTYVQKWIADDVAWWTPGVREVVNELSVD